MANPIIRIKRGSTTPANGVLSAGELAVDLTNKNLFVGQADGTPLTIGGEGTFATKTYVDTAVSGLGSAFEYVGTVDGGADAANATDLTALAKTEAGDYYKVSVAGHFNDGTTTFFANLNDGIVFNTTGGADLIDNTNSTVAGTANEIAVTGSADTGYTVAVDSAFSTRVSTSETKTQNIDLAETTAGTTKINDKVVVGMASGMPEFIVQGVMEPEVLKVSGESVTIAGSANPTGALIVNGQTALNGGVNVTGDVAVTGNISATGTVGGTNITDLESKTRNIDLAGTIFGQTKINDKLVVALGPASNAELVVQGLTADVLRVYNDSVEIVGGGSNASGDFQVTGKSVFTGEVSISGNLVGNGTSEITDFVIDGGTF